MRAFGAAAAADDADPVLQHKALEPLRQLARGQRIMRPAADQFGQTGIRHDRNMPGPVVAEPFDVLGHFARPGRAIQADHRHVERMDDRRRGGDVGADQQRAGRLDRDLDDDRDVLAGLRPRPLRAVDRRLDLQRVLAGLDQKRVDLAGDETGALHRQRVFQILIGDMSERRQPRARTDRAEDETGPAVTRNLGNRLARQFAGAAIEVERLVGDAELAERDRRAAKAVGRDRVGRRRADSVRWISRTRSGRLSQRISVQFSCPWKSRSMSRLRPCTCVPIAPSASSTRSAR